jgi:hypothetical protein
VAFHAGYAKSGATGKATDLSPIDMWLTQRNVRLA